MQLKWTHPAIADLKEGGQYIAEENPEAAMRMAERILEAVEYLVSYPNIGREGRLADSRELVVTGTPFLVIYRVRNRGIQILRVLHHAHRWRSK
jgi:addiction module RelE/StbE family toxin